MISLWRSSLEVDLAQRCWRECIGLSYLLGAALQPVQCRAKTLTQTIKFIDAFTTKSTTISGLVFRLVWLPLFLSNPWSTKISCLLSFNHSMNTDRLIIEPELQTAQQSKMYLEILTRPAASRACTTNFGKLFKTNATEREMEEFVQELSQNSYIPNMHECRKIYRIISITMVDQLQHAKYKILRLSGSSNCILL